MKPFFTLFLSSLLLFPASQVLAQNTGPLRQKGVLIAKVKSQYASSCKQESIELAVLQKQFTELGILSVKKAFPRHAKPEQLSNAQGQGYADISLIYYLNFNPALKGEKLLTQLQKSKYFEYVEPKYIPELLYTPNDPMLSTQYHLSIIKALEAWDITKGDTNVVIGITDTGTDTDHPDLSPKIKHNYADPVNGIDDDNDGYTDNFSGWDLGMNDNDPSINTSAPISTNPPHGARVSGCAAAASDNGVGVAGTAFNCKFLPVKIADASGYLSYSYEGIVYAADHGCQIINCSWGSVNIYSQFQQDIVTYASINKNCLVIAAAGNSGNEGVFYPASYQYVFSVAASNSSDVKWAGSNYGIYIDACAPGQGIITTMHDNSYTSTAANGTSLSCPIGAGGAALIKSKFPNYTGLQVGERLRITADNIDGVSGNSAFAGKLGRGRINLQNAVSTFLSPAIRVTQLNITDNGDGVFTGGDALSIDGIFTNYLDGTPNMVATISCTSVYATITQNTANLGAFVTLQSKNNIAQAYTVVLEPATPENTELVFRIDYKDGAYVDHEYFKILVNPDFITVEENNFSVSVMSNGLIGYNTSHSRGSGVVFKGENDLSFQTSFVLGASTSQVSDMIANTGNVDVDFTKVITVRPLANPPRSDYEANCTFDDSPAPNSLSMKVKQKVLAWKSAPNEDFVIFKYTISNTSANNYSSLYAGIFADWDIVNYALNGIETDLTAKMGYGYYKNAGAKTFIGIKLLTKQGYHHYGFDINGDSTGINITDGLDDADKYNALTTNRLSVGATGAGTDVAAMSSAGPISLSAGDSVTVAFALIGGESLAQLEQTATWAQNAYDGLSVGTNSINNLKTRIHPNPVQDELFVHSEETLNYPIHVRILSIEGCLVYEGDLSSPRLLTSQLKDGIYLLELETSQHKETHKLIKH